jgi:hypothetical protein
LLVELDKNETSQTVVFQGEPVFMRSPKILRPQDVSTPDFAARLLAELKRTRIAVRNEIQGIDVDDVALCGSGRTFESLAEQLTKGLEMPVRLFDPLKGLTVKAETADEQYTALFGAIQQAVRKEPMQIDFCNPKKRAEDTGKRNLVTGIAGVVMCLVLGVFGYAYLSRTTLERDVEDLKTQFEGLKRTSGAVVEQKKQLDAIDAWLANNVNWFEELGWLSQNTLPGRDMMIRDLSFTSANGGSIRFLSLLREQSLLASMEESLRDDKHSPGTGERKQSTHVTQYRFECNVNITLPKEETPKPAVPKPPGQ